MTQPPLDRRAFAAGLAALAASSAIPASAAANPWSARLAAIERRGGGRLGAYILDTATGRGFGWRAGERFAMCSTFKLSLAAWLLREIDAGRIAAGEVLAFGKGDLLPNSPVTGARIAQGRMTVVELAEAAQKTSDNLAANLLLHRLGGPSALTAFWRSLGDRTSRLDRYEMELNFVPHGDLRDTTTAEAISRTAARFLTGTVLSPASRRLLRQWMAGTTTGQHRLRAGLPAGWRGGDKTGTGSAPGNPTKVNDIAILQPPGRGAPLVVTAFYEPAGAPKDIGPEHEAVLAQVGALATAFGRYRQPG
jgi:beta-lactamase class A